MFSKIMIPVDLRHDDKMEKALRVVADLATKCRAEAHVVGVTMSSPTDVAPTPAAFQERLSDLVASHSALLGGGMKAHTEISHDISIDLDATLERAAERLGADLIVMASHIPGWSEHIFASNAGYLASHSKMSVFVVR